MSSEIHETTIAETAKLIQATAVEIAWKQWASLGAGALSAPEGRAASIIDPEALLLLSLVVQDAERRLVDFSAWWAEVGSELLSVQRTKTMLKHFPEPAAAGLDEFARLAVEAGDRRWKRYASDEVPGWGTRRLKGAAAPRLMEASTLMVRLRAGFGVNAKADALAFLLGIGGESATVQDIASAISYSTVTVRNALKDMVLARLIHETPDHPARYYVYLEPWAEVLDLGAPRTTNPPTWAYWYPVHAFLANAYVLFKQEKTETKSTYVLSSKARNVAEEFGRAFSKNRIPIPRPPDFRGAAYLEGFRETIAALRDWTLKVG
jgi:hypothetical protein